MVTRIGLDIPSAESVAERIDNVPSLSELELGNQALLANMQATTDAIGYEPPDETPQVFYSPSTRKMFVNGLMFDDDDAKTALQSVEKLKDRPLKPSLNVAKDWARVSPQDYGSYIKGIKNPQAGRLAAENFDIGGSNLKLLYGRASQFFGAEDYGQGYVDEAIREIEKNEPFQREFTNIKSGYIRDGDAGESHDAIDWFIANFAQQGPNLIESVAVALLGALAGGVTGANPFTAVGGAISTVLKKESYKSAVIKAAKKYQKDPASLDPGERKLLREISSLTAVAERQNPNMLMGIAVTPGYKQAILKKNKANLDAAIDAGVPGAAQRIRDVGKSQAIKGGAATGLGVSSYGIGLGDIYGEQREMGQDDRVSAALTAIPYAAMEMLPEFVLAARIFNVKPRVINKTLLEGTDQGGRTARALKGFGVGGALEGTTEVAQESLILANTGQLDAKSPQVQSRLVNAFAAGFFVGGPIGGVANLLARPSSDILNKNNQRTEPNDDPTPEATAGTTAGTVLGEQLPLPGIDQPTGRDKLAAGTRRILSEPVPDTPEVPTVSSQTSLILEDIQNKQTKKEIKDAEKDIDKKLETTETEDTTETKDINVDAAVANILKNNTKEEIKKVENVLENAEVATTTPGKAKLTAVDKHNQRLADIRTLDRAALSTYQLKSTSKDLKGKRRTIDSYVTQKIEGLDTEKLSEVLQTKLSRKATLEKAGKINTAEYRNIIEDIEAIQRYLALLVQPVQAGVEKTGADAGEEIVANNRLQEIVNEQEQIDELNKQNADILRKAKREEIKRIRKARKFADDNNVDRNSPEFLEQYNETVGEMGEADATEFAAEQVIEQRKEQEANKIKVEDYAGPFIVAKSLNPVFVNNVNETIDSVGKEPRSVFSGLTAQNMPPQIMQLAIEGAISLEYLKPNNKTSSASVVIRDDVQTLDKLTATLQMMAPIVLAAFKAGAVTNDSIVIEDDKGVPLAAAMYNLEQENKVIVEMIGSVNPEATTKIFNEIEKIRQAQGRRYTVLENVAGAQEAFKRRGFEVSKEGDEFYSPLETNLFKDSQQEGGKEDANTKQKAIKVVTGKQARGSGTTTAGDNETTDVDTADIKGVKEPVGEKEKGKAKLQVKKKEDTVRKTGKERITKPANIKRENKQTEVEREFEQKLRIDEINKARAKPKDFKKKYKNTQEAWDDIKPVIAGGFLIEKIPASINNSIAKAVQESTAIDTAEIRDLFLGLTEQDFIDINVDQTVYTNMRIAQFKAAILDNAVKESILSDIVDIGWLDKESKVYGDKLFTKNSVQVARNFLNNYFARTGVYTENEAVALDDIIYDRLTTSIAEEGATGLTGIQTGSELRIKEAIAWTKRRDRYQSIIDQRQKKELPELTGAVQELETDQSTPSETTINIEPEYTAIQVHDLIKNQISEAVGTVPIKQPARSRPKKNIEEKYAQLSDEDKNYGINKEGDLLSDYFDDKGKLVTYRTTSAEGDSIHKPIRKQNLKERETRIKTETKDKAANLKKGEKKLTEYAIVESGATSGYSLKTSAEAEAKDLPIEQTFMAASLSEARTYMKNYLNDPLFDISLDDKPVDTDTQAFLTKKDLSEKDIDDILADVDDNPEDTNFFRLDGSIIKNPVPILRVKAIVNRALSKLKLKPKATIVKDKAELESKFPELYERAVAGRQQGDFDTTNFAAFSLGDEIVVLADNIKTEEQLKFIVAHETLGHFGLRAFVPDGKLNAVLEDLYNSEGHIKAVADMHIKNGMDKYIAIEEAMANAAATLDVSAIQRMWFAIKNFLNKIGIKFDDDLSRYILSQSRRNLRTGGGSYFNVKQLVSNMQDEYDRATQTRFYTEQMNTSLPASIFGMFGLTANSTFGSFNNFKEVIKNKFGKDTPTSIGEALEYLQTLGNISNRNEGMRSIFNIFGMQAKKIKSLERTYETLTQFSTKPNAFQQKYKDEVVITTTKEYNELEGKAGSGIEPGALGPTNLELEQAGKLLSYAALFKAKQNGEDSTVAKPLDKDGEEISLRKEVEGGQALNREAAKELGDMGIVSIEEFTKGIPFDISLEDDTGAPTTGIFKPQDGSSHGGANFNITPRLYKIYLEMRTAINKSAVDVFDSSLEATTFERQDAINNFLESVGQDSNLTGARETFELIMEKYRQIRQEGATGNKQTKYTRDAKDKSALFIREINRALFEPLKLKDWRDGNAGIGIKENYSSKNWNNETKKPTGDPRFTFDPKEYERIIEGLEELNVIFNKKQDEANTVTNTIKSLFVLEEATKQTEFNSKRTLMTGYVQFVRRGKYQVETVAFDKDRNMIKLDQQYKNAMPYFQAETAQDAREIQEQVNNTFGENPFVVKDRSGQEIEVTLEASTSIARTASLLSLDQNLAAFIRIADDLQINISAEDRDKIIKGLTDTGSAARQKLPRAGKPGWDKDVVRSQAMFLRAQSHLAGKTYFEHKLNTVLASENQWLGDRDKLNRLKKTLDNAEQFGNEQEKQLARANYDSYANMYRYSAGTTTNTKDEFTIYEMKGVLADKRTPRQVKPEGRGEDYRQQAQDLLAYYSSGENIVDSTEDILDNTKVGQNLRVLAVSSQLGGSVATALINTMSMVTHSIPYLATYNPKTGYGGGFGMVDAAYEMQRAAREMSDATRTRLGLTEAGAEQSLANLDWMNKVAGFDPETGEYTADPKLAEQLQKQYNISPDEAQAIHKATSDGVLQAAQYNALVGTARGGLTNTTSGMLKKWMSLFSYTEQLNRRATFLAAYRLQKAKLRAANAEKFNVKNITPERTAELNKEIELEASKFAEVAVNTSQGEYSMFNRPKISRGPLLNSIMMYKQFVMISVELMKNLGRNERIYFLMLLFLLSGMKGLPFAEDIADLLDVLLQIAGVEMGTVEKELTMFIEEVAPGASPVVMRGFLDKLTGATMSTRLGFGDLVPLTGFFKEGARFEQEVTNFLGPVYASGEQTFAALSLFGNYTAGKIGLKADTTRFRDVLRAQPFGGIRGIVDAYSYYDDGVITNKQGKVLDKDVHFREIFFRALNFHPASASYQNDIIRMTKQTSDYVKSFKLKFSEAYVKARISGDRAEMRRIERAVRDHNRTHRNSEFYLDDWKASANRMYDAWKLPSAERFKKFSTKRSRPDINKLMEAYGID